MENGVLRAPPPITASLFLFHPNLGRLFDKLSIISQSIPRKNMQPPRIKLGAPVRQPRILLMDHRGPIKLCWEARYVKNPSGGKIQEKSFCKKTKQPHSRRQSTVSFCIVKVNVGGTKSLIRRLILSCVRREMEQSLSPEFFAFLLNLKYCIC
jgi:hypothetical protein